MKNFLITTLLTLFLTPFAWSKSVEVDVTMTPAGSFTAKTQAVKGGKAMKVGNGFIAKGIKVDLSTLETGVSLRNKHARQKLGAYIPEGTSKRNIASAAPHRYATLLKAKGKDGKGLALIEIKGKKLKVKGNYKIKGNTLHCDFDMKLSQLGIDNIRYMGIGVHDSVKVKVEVPISEKKG